ncbi:MAG: hypothetical protein RIC03_06870 [Cyclobacteriaceae bacterium]
MKTANAAQIKLIRTILIRHGLGDTAEKEATILEYTDGRTTHISDMTHSEINKFVTAFQGAGDSEKRKRMVGKIVHLAHQMEWHLPGTEKVDFKRIDNWCRRYSPPHVPLDKIKTHELGKVVTIFNKVYLDFLNSI